MIIPQSETVSQVTFFESCAEFRISGDDMFKLKEAIFPGRWAWQGVGVLWGKMNAHIRLRLPDRARAQHLLGCVCARLCEWLEAKAFTTHYTADKPVCVRDVSQKPWLLPPHAGCCRFGFLLNTAEPLVTTLTCVCVCEKRHRACIHVISIS